MALPKDRDGDKDDVVRSKRAPAKSGKAGKKTAKKKGPKKGKKKK